MLVRQFACALLLFHAARLLGGEVRLGPETPVLPVQSGPAAYEQGVPKIASNGHDFLAAWIDAREQTSANYQLYATRLDVDGRPLEPFGRRLADANALLGVAFAEGTYLLLYHRYDRVFQIRYYLLALDETGMPRGPERELDPSVFPNGAFGLYSNGSTFLVLEYDFPMRQYVAVLIDRDGVVLGELPLGLTLSTGPFGSAQVTVNAGLYDILGHPLDCTIDCDVPVLRTIDARPSGMLMGGTKLRGRFRASPPRP